MTRQLVRIAACALLLCAAGETAARADERILAYHSDIEIHPDSTVTVTESIRVRAEGAEIKRGIYRDFPTRYRDRNGKRVRVGFSILSVKRNGEDEPHHVERINNGQRVKIGSKNVFIPPGVYTYEIAYRTTRQIGFFDKHDELYWNVTGTDWSFPIDRASARVVMPEGIDPRDIRVEGYTGPQGSKATDLESSVEADGAAHFVTTKMLGAKSGLTIVVMWPKGHVRQQTAAEELKFTLLNDSTFLVAFSGLALMLIYYAGAWVLVGRDPEKGTIIPRFVPPGKTSPAAARYIMRMGYDQRCFAAALINLAVRRYVTLEEEDGQFTVHKLNTEGGKISQGEQKVFSKLLGHRSTLTLKQAYNSTIRGAVEGLETALKGEHAKENFRTNGLYLIPGFVVAILTLVAVVIAAGAPELGFLALWLSIWTLGVVGLLTQVVNQWRQVLTGANVVRIGGAIFISLFALPFVAAEIFVGYIFARSSSIPTVLTLLMMGPFTCWFHHLLKAPTRGGRKLMDALEGFKQYLSVAEEDRLAALHPPEKTPELFEAYLPYALALDVEQEWSERFADVLAGAGREQGGEGYSPAWYSSRSGFTTPAALAGSIGNSLSSAVASSSTAPGSSSGGGGGGSSGGGGGGGGGGGW